MTARQARGEARRDAILDAAERLTVEVGAAGLSLRAVAAACDIRLGHLQHYFPSREALVEDLLARALARSEAEIAGLLAQGDLAGALDALLEEQRRPAAIRLFWELWALAARDRGVARALRRFYDGWVEAVAAVLPARGGDHAATADRARLLVFCLEGLSLTRSGVLGPRSRRFDAAARSVLAELAGIAG